MSRAGRKRTTRKRAGAGQLAGAFVGSVIGAGFASGQEHLLFFVSFGPRWLWGVLVAGAALTVMGGLILYTAYRHDTRSHLELLQAVCPPPLAFLFDAIFCLSMFASLAVMMSGGGALLEEAGLAPAPTGALVLGFAAAAVVSLGVRLMLRVNAVLTVLLVVMIGLIGVWVGLGAPAGTLLPQEALAGAWLPRSWLAAAGLYASYNLMYTFSLFGALGADVASARSAWAGGTVGGAILAVLSAAVCFSVAAVVVEARGSELPMLFAAAKVGVWAGRAYALIIWAAMFTTAIAGIYVLHRRVEMWWPARPALIPFLIVAASAPLSTAAFRDLVATVYPIAGYAGAGCIAATLLHWLPGRSSRSHVH